MDTLGGHSGFSLGQKSGRASDTQQSCSEERLHCKAIPAHRTHSESPGRSGRPQEPLARAPIRVSSHALPVSTEGPALGRAACAVQHQRGCEWPQPVSQPPQQCPQAPRPSPGPSQTRATYPAVHVPLALGHVAPLASTPSPRWPATERKGRKLGRRVRAPGPHGQAQEPAGMALPSPWTSLGGPLGEGWGQRWGLSSQSPCCRRIPEPRHRSPAAS